MSKIITIHVSELIKGSSSNAEGYVLFLEMDKIMSSGNSINLSLLGCALFSSSFLSSSIGSLFDKYGAAKLAGKISLSNATNSQKKNMKDYFDSLKSFQK